MESLFACVVTEQGKDSYADPATGYTVFTAHYHKYASDRIGALLMFDITGCERLSQNNIPGCPLAGVEASAVATCVATVLTSMSTCLPGEVR